jgi:multiple sugar transport system substrate-binding protein
VRIGWIGALAALLLVGSCARPSGRVVLKVWAMGAEGDAIGKLIPAFEKANPGIEVDVEQIPFAEAHQKLLTGFAGDSLPDMAQLGNSWLPEFEALGALAPLDARVVATPAIDPADYFPGIWDSNVIDRRLYGVPWYVDTRLLFYRRDILKRAGFDRPPTTWAEWHRQMVAIKKLVGPGRYAAIFPLNEYEPLEVLGLQQAEPMVTADGHGNFESPGFKRALAFYLGTIRSGLAPAIANTEIANIWDQFDRGEFSFYITGPWQLGEFARRIPAAHQSEWATAPMPGPDGPGASNAGGSSLVIFHKSRHQEAAWKLIAWLSTPAMELRFHQLTGDLPPRRSAWRAPELADDPHAKAFAEQLERVKPTPKVPEWEAIATAMRTVTEAAAHDTMPVDQVAAEIDRQADAILAKRRWMLGRRSVRAEPVEAPSFSDRKKNGPSTSSGRTGLAL